MVRGFFVGAGVMASPGAGDDGFAAAVTGARTVGVGAEGLSRNGEAGELVVGSVTPGRPGTKMKGNPDDNAPMINAGVVLSHAPSNTAPSAG